MDKRIDVLAVAIQAGMTVFDLEEMELAYAPQYGSAKDPVNMAGFVAAGLLRGDHPQIDLDAALRQSADGESSLLLLDVRTPQEFAGGCIPGAVNVPLDELRISLGRVAPRPRHWGLLPSWPAGVSSDADSRAGGFSRRQHRRRLSDVPPVPPVKRRWNASQAFDSCNAADAAKPVSVTSSGCSGVP